MGSGARAYQIRLLFGTFRFKEKIEAPGAPVLRPARCVPRRHARRPRSPGGPWTRERLGPAAGARRRCPWRYTFIPHWPAPFPGSGPVHRAFSSRFRSPAAPRTRASGSACRSGAAYGQEPVARLPSARVLRLAGCDRRPKPPVGPRTAQRPDPSRSKAGTRCRRPASIGIRTPPAAAGRYRRRDAAATAPPPPGVAPDRTRTAPRGRPHSSRHLPRSRVQS